MMGYCAPRMLQGDLFPRRGLEPSGSVFERVEMDDADVTLWPDFLSPAQAGQLYQDLLVDVDWERESYVMYGRDIASPRLTAWYGDAGRAYEYSGVRHDPTPWERAPALSGLRERIQSASQARFNSVLLNYYREGRDSVAWHSDDEQELGPRPVIASLSLGAQRVFQFKRREHTGQPRIDIELPPGSLLLMAGDCQRYWLHQLPKRK